MTFAFAIGSKVCITNPGQVYSTYINWLNTFCSAEEKVHHAYNEIPPQNATATVVAHATHLERNNIAIYAVQTKDQKLYIMGEDGLEAAPENTSKEKFTPNTISFEDLLKGAK